MKISDTRREFKTRMSKLGNTCIQDVDGRVITDEDEKGM